MAGFIVIVLGGLLSFLSFILIAAAIASWLVQFGIINAYNPNVRQILGLLDSISSPIVEPFRRIIPPFGNLDLSFVVALLVIQGLQYVVRATLAPALFQLFGS